MGDIFWDAASYADAGADHPDPESCAVNRITDTLVEFAQRLGAVVEFDCGDVNSSQDGVEIMAFTVTNLEPLIEEYETFLREAQAGQTAPVDWHQLTASLVQEGAWTPKAAQELIALSRDYGVFVLRNALALALALGIEDGDLGY